MKCCANHDQVMRLIVEDESQATRVYVRDKKVRGRTIPGTYMVFVEGGPHYNVESTTDSKSVFICQARTNKPVGLIKDGVLRNRNVDKDYFFHKLNLYPQNPKQPVLPTEPKRIPEPAEAKEIDIIVNNKPCSRSKVDRQKKNKTNHPQM